NLGERLLALRAELEEPPARLLDVADRDSNGNRALGHQVTTRCKGFCRPRPVMSRSAGCRLLLLSAPPADWAPFGPPPRPKREKVGRAGQGRNTRTRPIDRRRARERTTSAKLKPSASSARSGSPASRSRNRSGASR